MNGRVIMLDRRGTGLSDRPRDVRSAESTMDDIRAVMDAVGSERAVLWSGGNATGIAVLFAATYPERTAGLILFDPRVVGTRSPEYPWARPRALAWAVSANVKSFFPQDSIGSTRPLRSFPAGSPIQAATDLPATFVRRPGSQNDETTTTTATMTASPKPVDTPAAVTLDPRTAPARLAPRTPPR